MSKSGQKPKVQKYAEGEMQPRPQQDRYLSAAEAHERSKKNNLQSKNISCAIPDTLPLYVITADPKTSTKVEVMTQEKYQE